MNRYIINKLGLINFWYYDIEEFKLSSGNLLLRGSNGSGKSVTMQSFIPLLLDGNKAPDRLDPFGTKARTIGNYLLNEEDTEKTAYLYMEFKNESTDNYITVGMGMKAVKNKPLQSWYFILKDGRRINKELKLYRDSGEHIPLTKKQLQNELGTLNFYTESQKAYMEAVNKHLFGFDSIEAYEELLNLLISIRSPKLSKDFKPTEIYKILTESLKVLSDEDLRPISDSMENMDTLKDALDEGRNALKAINNIKYHYDRYNNQVLVEKSKTLLEAHKNLRDGERSSLEKTKEFEELANERVVKGNELQEMENQLRSADEKYEQLINKEEFRMKKELDNLQENLESNQGAKEQKEATLDIKKKVEAEIYSKVRDYKDNVESLETKFNEAANTIEELAKEMYFNEGLGLQNENIREITEEHLVYLDGASKKYEKKLKEAETALIEFENQKNKLEEINKDIDMTKVDYQEQQNNMVRAEELFSTEKEAYKISLNKLMDLNTLYILNDEEKLEIFKNVEAVEDYFHIQQCKNFLNDAYNFRVNDVKGKIQLEETFINALRKDINKLNEEINELKNNKEIGPERSESVENNRRRLKEQGIEYIPLYKALDFGKDMKEEVKGNIEAALIDMGLLDALIISPKDRKEALNFKDNMADRYIFADPNLMSYNLSSILTVDKDLKCHSLYEEVFNTLQSVFLEKDNSTYLKESGYYGLGILNGKSKLGYIQRYIGEASRKRHREELIKNKEQEIEEINLHIGKHKKSIELLSNDIEILAVEYNKLPSTDNILEALKLIKELQIKLKNLDDKLIELGNKEFEERKGLDTIRLKVMERMEGLEGFNNVEGIRSILEILQEYKEGLGKLGNILTKFQGQLNLLKAKEEEQQRILKDIDDLYYEINLLSRKINEDEIRKNAILEVLSKVDISEIQKEIEFCIIIKKKNPQEIKSLSSALGKARERQDSLEKEIEKIKEEIQRNAEDLKLCENIFNEEYNLEYITKKSEGNLVKICKSLVEDLPSSEDKTREFYSNNLTEAVNRNLGELREYNLKFINLFSENTIEERRWLRDRRDIRCKIQGKDVTFFVLLEEIKKSIEEYELLISEEERRIFEEILMNTISQKVQAKIHQSMAWVKKINDLMNTMDTSSSLKLSLTWTPRRAESEGQLDIENVTKIFSLGDRNTESDLKNLGKHFSQKVRDELRKYEGTGEVRNYHSIIKDVLDYRQWYEFKLHFVKNNERKKELTNTAFFQFSGGEKAMSMYIPLFSAIYARYDKGRSDCPRIISMDEAFAGVDENNIRDMFRLLKQLNLQYILNSQILWGDYDTVDNLSICELIREENDDVVTILRYHWNGNERQLVN